MPATTRPNQCSFQAEIAHPSIRGRLTTLQQVRVHELSKISQSSDPPLVHVGYRRYVGFQSKFNSFTKNYAAFTASWVVSLHFKFRRFRLISRRLSARLTELLEHKQNGGYLWEFRYVSSRITSDNSRYSQVHAVRFSQRFHSSHSFSSSPNRERTSLYPIVRI